MQHVVGAFLLCVCAVNPTMLAVLSANASEQADPTKKMEKANSFLDWAGVHPDAALTRHASKMILAAHSNTLHLNEQNGRMHAMGHTFMSDQSKIPPNNEVALTIAQILKRVASSAAEGKLGALFLNSKEGVPTRTTHEEMDHKHPPTL